MRHVPSREKKTLINIFEIKQTTAVEIERTYLKIEFKKKDKTKKEELDVAMELCRSPLDEMIENK